MACACVLGHSGAVDVWWGWSALGRPVWTLDGTLTAPDEALPRYSLRRRPHGGALLWAVWVAGSGVADVSGECRALQRPGGPLARTAGAPVLAASFDRPASGRIRLLYSQHFAWASLNWGCRRWPCRSHR